MNINAKSMQLNAKSMQCSWISIQNQCNISATPSSSWISMQNQCNISAKSMKNQCKVNEHQCKINANLMNINAKSMHINATSMQRQCKINTKSMQNQALVKPPPSPCQALLPEPTRFCWHWFWLGIPLRSSSRQSSQNRNHQIQNCAWWWWTVPARHQDAHMRGPLARCCSLGWSAWKPWARTGNFRGPTFCFQRFSWDCTWPIIDFWFYDCLTMTTLDVQLCHGQTVAKSSKWTLSWSNSRPATATTTAAALNAHTQRQLQSCRVPQLYNFAAAAKFRATA